MRLLVLYAAVRCLLTKCFYDVNSRQFIKSYDGKWRDGTDSTGIVVGQSVPTIIRHGSMLRALICCIIIYAKLLLPFIANSLTILLVYVSFPLIDLKQYEKGTSIIHSF